MGISVRHSVAMPAETVVRVARDEDYDAVGELCVEAYDAAHQLEPGSPYAATLVDARGRASDSLVLVAERDGQLVGTVTICLPGSESREIGRDDEVEFRFLAVAPSAQRTGVADSLMAAIEEHAVEVGARRLAICVRDTNTGAAAMYERRGFVRVPERDWSPRPGVDLLALTREVRPGSR